MLIWLASYPKSGNTLMRAMLASYFFSQDGKFNFELLPNIKQFPSNQFLKNLNIDTNNDDEVLKNYINAQSKFNKKKAIQFVKTHCGFNKVNGYNFTNFDITLGAIYIIRDPRNLVESFSRHYSFSIDQSVDFLIKGLIYLHFPDRIKSRGPIGANHFQLSLNQSLIDLYKVPT